MESKRKKSSGVTLVELLVVSGIALGLAAVIVTAFISGQRSFIMGTNLLEIHADARLAIEWIVRDVQWTNRILASVDIGGTTYTTGANEIVLSIPSVDAGNDIINGTFDSVVYTLNGTDLMRLVAPDAASSRMQLVDTIANNITNLQFTSATDIITVSLTAQKTVLISRVINKTLNTSIKMRNF